MSSVSANDISPAVSKSPKCFVTESTPPKDAPPSEPPEHTHGPDAFKRAHDPKKVTFNNSASLPTSSNESSDAEDDLHKLTPTVSKDSSKYFTKYALKKLPSYPYGTERMTQTKSLDSQLSTDSNSNLPEFNKRPLTDTPIVSSVASPDSRYSDDELNDNDNEKPRQKSNQTAIDEVDDEAISKIRNISHLNLADWASQASSSSVSPFTTKDVSPVPELQPESQARIQKTEPLPMPSPAPPELAEVGIVDEEFKLPLNLQKQLEKTASLEKIKSMLTTKPKKKKAYTLNIPGQTSSKISPDGRIAQVDVGSKLVIVMVGLPARGKSYITNKLTRYLNWLQHDCRVFNVGNTRRLDKLNNGPENKPLPDVHTPNNEASTPPKSPASPKEHNADFFSPDNKSYTALREKWAMDTLEQLLNYVIDGPGSVGIFDATNSTKHRRLKVLKRIQQRSNGELKVLFLESICDDPAIIESNIRLKLSGPDYRDMDPEIALKDFVGRLKNYEKAYETIDEQEEKIPGFQYVKMINVGKKVVSYNIQGFLASQAIYFLLNFNLCERQIWITRHGESVDNLSGKIGGNSALTKRGRKFAKALAKFMKFQRQEFRKKQLEAFSNRLEVKYNALVRSNSNEGSPPPDDPTEEIPTEPNFYVWTSMLIRAVETGQYFDDQLYSIKEMRMLNELGGGKFEGLTYEEIQSRYPKEFQARIQNKLTYRYPGVGGESYLDVLTRLRPLITEIERTTDHLVIISHRVVLRILLAYFLNLDRSSIGELDVPLHTLYCLEARPYGTDYRMYEFDEHLEWFVKVEPEHRKNVKEVGVVFKERKYSVVPTAPPNSNAKNNHITRKPTLDRTKFANNKFSIRRSISQGFKPPANANFMTNGVLQGEDLSPNSTQEGSNTKQSELDKLRKP